MTNILAGKRNLFILIGAIVVLIAALIIFFLTGEKPGETFYGITGLDAAAVSRLSIADGTTGEKVLVEERETIENFFRTMDSLEFFLERDPAQQAGWAYSVDIYQVEEEFLRVVFAGDRVQFQQFFPGEKESYVAKPGAYYQVSSDVTGEIEALFTAAVPAPAEEESEEEEEETAIEPVVVKEIYPAIAVVYDNYPAARPPAGLQVADIVYEFLVEGGTTRYLAIFKTFHEENFNIGPIRSLRPYFAVQALEYGGIVAHSGYSTRTEQLIRGLGLTQIGDYQYFWRDSSRRAPHNLFTNIKNLYRAAGEKPKVVETKLMPQGELQEPFEKQDTIEINYSATNRVRYDYDAEERVYYRFINDTPHTDKESGEQYFANRIIVRITPHANVPGPEGLVDIDLEGSGEGYLYELGGKIPVTWKKVGHETVFSYPGGDPVIPIKGTTWIQVVRR